MANYGYAKADITNSYDIGLGYKTASNSLTVAVGDFIKLVGDNNVALAGAGDTIEGVSVTAKTFDSDNLTVALEKVAYRPATQQSRYKLPIVGGTITIADEGNYFDIDSNQAVDGTSESSSSGQLRLERFISATVGIFSIANK